MTSKRGIGWVIGKISSLVHGVANILAVVLMILMVSSLSAAVISRYVFNRPIFWTDEFSRIVLIWTIFVGAGLAFRSDTLIEHISMDFAAAKFPPRVRQISNRIIWAINFLFCAAILIVGTSFLSQTISIPTAALGISRGVIYAALPFFAMVSLCFLLDSLFHK